MKNIGLRVDGNEIIATGHIMRCLSIARALSNPSNNIISQNNIYFIVSDAKSESLLKERMSNTENFNVLLLNSEYNKLDKEVSTLVDLVSQHDILSLFIDSYFVSEDYLKALHRALIERASKLIYIDDLQALSHYDVDVIINYNTAVIPNIYSDIPCVLTGASYTPLREQFAVSKSTIKECTIKETVTDIFISAGGTDSYNINKKLIESFEKAYENTFNYHILTSTLNSHYEELKDIANSNSRIHIYTNVTNVAKLMSNCDLAISAGGTTLCELCAVGIPTVSFSFVDNQINSVKTFDSNGIIPYAGDVRLDTDNIINNISDLSAKIIKMDVHKRTSIHNKMQSYIDGNGALRIAKAIR